MSDIVIRRAEEKDLQKVDELLFQVNKVHSDARPDLFKPGAKKYTDAELKEIFQNDKTPVFVACINGEVVGYAFCIFKQFVNDNNLTDIKTLYIDDLCVDENVRGRHIGTALYEYVLSYAKQNGFYNVTLNVWADNPGAVKFYEKIGLRVQKIGMEKIL
ncbi:MAG: GNAT family N-acetyltransferase [Oscillospiraceae bacterium]|jgi:ribosomal protein S18 acetylase RimI-like enzyme|nr:GNAT family N-acetyltransferase [Ruminococcus sp.]MDD7337116.1 GNAT family N-acetyltransferase [Ruminococcus sp.]MDY6060988.1 GNAT family N-acetyltransferase [Oscillospiraceae bacterium]